MLVVASRISPKLLKRGMFTTEIMLVAGEFGRKTDLKFKFDLEDDTGIVNIRYPDDTEHVVFLTNGLIFEPTGGAVWDAEQYVKAFKIKTMSLITEV